MQITKALFRQQECTFWFAPLVFVYKTKTPDSNMIAYVTEFPNKHYITVLVEDGRLTVDIELFCSLNQTVFWRMAFSKYWFVSDILCISSYTLDHTGLKIYLLIHICQKVKVIWTISSRTTFIVSFPRCLVDSQKSLSGVYQSVIILPCIVDYPIVIGWTPYHYFRNIIPRIRTWRNKVVLCFSSENDSST